MCVSRPAVVLFACLPVAKRGAAGKKAAPKKEPDANEALRQKIIVRCSHLWRVAWPCNGVDGWSCGAPTSTNVQRLRQRVSFNIAIHHCLPNFQKQTTIHHHPTTRPTHRIIHHLQAKLRGETLPDPDEGAGADGAGGAAAGGAGADAGGDPGLPAAAESTSSGNNLKDKIAARLAAIRNDGPSPPTSPTSSIGAGSAAASPTRGIQRNPDHVPANIRCTTKDQVRRTYCG